MTDAIEKLFEQPVYGLNQPEKDRFLLDALNQLSLHHRDNCAPYMAISSSFGSLGEVADIADIPFLPVRLFKEHFLESVTEDERFKILTSSGTTGQQVSRISLDRKTAGYQTKALVKIMQEFLGKERLPMLIIDHPGVVKDRLNFSARGAGILGMSNFGRQHAYALMDETMSVDFDVVDAFLEKAAGNKTLLFGFTFMVWKYLVRALEESGRKLDLSNGILVHSGGWKKLQDEAVDNEEFKRRLNDVTGVTRVHNFYGMVEQVGSVFVECEDGHLHVPSFADVIVRRTADFSVAPIGEEGLIQVLSCLPHSYPGHSLLTEDLGALTGVDTCSCGRLGKTFSVAGRLPKAEVRGCSDTFDGKKNV